jgi:hypothetical protein
MIQFVVMVQTASDTGSTVRRRRADLFLRLCPADLAVPWRQLVPVIRSDQMHQAALDHRYFRVVLLCPGHHGHPADLLVLKTLDSDAFCTTTYRVCL